MLLLEERKAMDGKRLRQLRMSKKLTQTELGKIINVSKVSISGYENGTRTPDTDNLRRLADYFRVNSDYLLGRSDDPNIMEEEKRQESSLQQKINKLVREHPNMNLMFDGLDQMDDETLEPFLDRIIEMIEFENYRNKKSK